jgi:hypothetical protein
MSSTGGSRERESVLVALRSVLHREQFLRAWVRRWWGDKSVKKENDIPCICLFHDFGLDKGIETLLYVNLTVLGRWYRQG